MRSRTAQFLVTLVLLSPGPAWAQQDSTYPAPNPAQAETLDYTFTISQGEAVRAFLVGGATYRAELNGKGIRLRLRPVQPGTQAPLVEALVPGKSASGTSLFTIRPRADGEYEFRTVGGASSSSVSLHLTRQPVHAKPG